MEKKPSAGKMIALSTGMIIAFAVVYVVGGILLGKQEQRDS